MTGGMKCMQFDEGEIIELDERSITVWTGKTRYTINLDSKPTEFHIGDKILYRGFVTRLGPLEEAKTTEFWDPFNPPMETK